MDTLFPMGSPKGGISDNEVIAKVLNGEKDLYEIIVRRYNDRLHRIGMSMINNEAEVKDAVQTAYIHAYENLSKFSFKAPFSSWLTRILINECILRLKKIKRLILLHEKATADQIWAGRARELQTPAARMMNTELKMILEKAIHQLPEKYRTVFVLREVEKMTIAETQARLCISESNVKVRLNRAKVLLKKILNKYYNKDDIFYFHLDQCNAIVKKVFLRINVIPQLST